MKNLKIAYWIFLSALSIMMLVTAYNFLFNKGEVAQLFNSLGYRPFLIIPMAIAKILGVLAIVIRMTPRLKDWAYAGFFFDFGLAGYSHLIARDGLFYVPVIALILLIVIIYLDTRIFARSEESTFG